MMVILCLAIACIALVLMFIGSFVGVPKCLGPRCRWVWYWSANLTCADWFLATHRRKSVTDAGFCHHCSMYLDDIPKWPPWRRVRLMRLSERSKRDLVHIKNNDTRSGYVIFAVALLELSGFLHVPYTPIEEQMQSEDDRTR